MTLPAPPNCCQTPPSYNCCVSPSACVHFHIPDSTGTGTIIPFGTSSGTAEVFTIRTRCLSGHSYIHPGENNFGTQVGIPFEVLFDSGSWYFFTGQGGDIEQTLALECFGGNTNYYPTRRIPKCPLYLKFIVPNLYYYYQGEFGELLHSVYHDVIVIVTDPEFTTCEYPALQFNTVNTVSSGSTPVCSPGYVGFSLIGFTNCCIPKRLFATITDNSPLVHDGQVLCPCMDGQVIQLDYPEDGLCHLIGNGPDCIDQAGRTVSSTLEFGYGECTDHFGIYKGMQFYTSIRCGNSLPIIVKQDNTPFGSTCPVFPWFANLTTDGFNPIPNLPCCIPCFTPGAPLVCTITE